MFPLLDPQHFVGALWDPVEGHLDPSGTTHAYAKAARVLGASIELRNPVKEITQAPMAHGRCTPSMARSPVNMWSMQAAFGRARWGAWWAWNCRFWPWSICIC
jgi:hypothetical protein